VAVVRGQAAIGVSFAKRAGQGKVCSGFKVRSPTSILAAIEFGELAIEELDLR